MEVCSEEELRAEGFKVASVDGHTVLVLMDQGKVYALDNRCPHMGFPLHRGTVGDGILTCHWHHAKFDLAGGCTFDPFADDVTSFYAEVRDGTVWLDPRPSWRTAAPLAQEAGRGTEAKHQAGDGQERHRPQRHRP